MEKTVTRIFIKDESLRFAAGHMTVFPDGAQEGLHGHNYQPELVVQLRDGSFSKMISFSIFKTVLQEIAHQWDEKVLLPAKCPFLTRKETSDPRDTEFVLGSKRYVLPTEDVEWLPVESVCVEAMAQEVLRRLLDSLKSQGGFENVMSLDLRVDEFDGLGASCRWERGQG